MSHYIIAVDPGARHVGVSYWWLRKPSEVPALEIDANTALKHLANNIRRESPDTLIVESFVLYPDKAAAQAWQDMETSEMIGALKWIAKKSGVDVVMQGANIKNPTRAQCAARGITYRHRSPHATDARLHMLHYLLRHKLYQKETT